MKANGHTNGHHDTTVVEYTPRERVSGDNTKKQIKLMVIDDPAISAVEIIDHLAKRNVAPSKFTVEGIRSETRQTLKLLVERGLINMQV